MSDLRRDESKFFNYFRMSMTTFDDLLKRVNEDLKKHDTNMRKSITPEEKLAICLRYLASGCSYMDLHYAYRVGVSTINSIIVEVTNVIWNNLHQEFMKLPDTKYEWEQIADAFYNKANFPHCIGAVDGKHIRMKKPSHSGSMYMNYKNFFSIVLLAVVDSNYRFTYISVGSYGKECDSSIFKESTFWKRLNDGSLDLPEARPLFTGLESRVPFVIVGDEAFGLHYNLLRPYGGTHLDKNKRIFNYRLTRARRYVECAFGILANKWRIFHRPLDVSTSTAISIVKTCAVLHNYIMHNESSYANIDSNDSTISLENVRNEPNTRGGRCANTIRTEFTNYFVSEVGAVPWQDEAIQG
ncbi:uncharacterized protein LOC132904419 [Amyelois transitella]|nr:uncharacterized protein LOC132904419 [Amyelois transitella]